MSTFSSSVLPVLTSNSSGARYGIVECSPAMSCISQSQLRDQVAARCWMCARHRCLSRVAEDTGYGGTYLLQQRLLPRLDEYSRSAGISDGPARDPEIDL